VGPSAIRGNEIEGVKAFSRVELYALRDDPYGMRRATRVAVIIVASALLFIVVAPVVYTSKFAYSVEIPAQGCGLSCNLSSGYSMNQVCYETLSYYFFGVGGVVCHFERG
jgi:hypothetical protein